MSEILCSVVVPVFNEELVVTESYNRLKSAMDSLEVQYELIFVNDGSQDGTSEILSGICRSDNNVKLIEFSRNFGHQIAITAGMDYSCGNTVVIIDADLQDPPEIIPKMLDKWREGYDVVYGVRIRREGETLFKKATSILFYRLLKKIAEVDMPLDTGDFRLVDRKVCDALKKVNEKSRYMRGLISWLGFRQTGIEYVRDKRFAGETKYPLRKMLRFAFDGIASFSYKPLKLAGWCGYVITAACLVYLLAALIISGPSGINSTVGEAANTVASSIATPELPQISQASAILKASTVSPTSVASGINTYLALSLLINGIMLISLGIIGAYIGRIYDEVKARPLYIVKSTRNTGTPADINLEGRRSVYFDGRHI